MDSSRDTVSSVIRALRSRSGQTQTDLAHEMDVAVSTLARYETSAQVPKLPVLRRLMNLARKKGFNELAASLERQFEQIAREKEVLRSSKRKELGVRIYATWRAMDRALRETEEIASAAIAQFEMRDKSAQPDDTFDKIRIAREAIDDLMESVTSLGKRLDRSGVEGQHNKEAT